MTMFTKDHEWIVVSDQDGIWRVGITEHAQDQLGDVITVELPEVGTSFASGDICAVVESVKAASDIYCPISGEIVKVNAGLEDQPELVNESAEKDGWLFEVKASEQVNASEFMDAKAYAESTAS